MPASLAKLRAPWGKRMCFVLLCIFYNDLYLVNSTKDWTGLELGTQGRLGELWANVVASSSRVISQAESSSRKFDHFQGISNVTFFHQWQLLKAGLMPLDLGMDHSLCPSSSTSPGELLLIPLTVAFSAKPSLISPSLLHSHPWPQGWSLHLY